MKRLIKIRRHFKNRQQNLDLVLRKKSFQNSDNQNHVQIVLFNFETLMIFLAIFIT